MRDINDIFQTLTCIIDCAAWDLRYCAEDDGNGLDDTQCRIYLIATQTGWYSHGAVYVGDLIDAEEDLQRSDLTHDDVARVLNTLINSFKNEVVTPEDAELYLGITAFWLIGTDAFKQLKERRLLDSHVFVFWYLTQSGNMILRPSYSANSTVDFYGLDDVWEFTRQVVASDKTGETHVGRLLAEQGGAVLPDIFI